MKNKLLILIALVLPLFILSCNSVPETPSSGHLSAKLLRLVENAVFEVVLEKPVEDPTVYEKELNWEMVPYAIRNDKYHSIGTAFAISGTELITAFHVINLGFESMVYDRYFVRDSKGNVYEIDQVNGGSNEKDYLVFTVKGKTFDDFFQFEQNYKTGDPVLSIGNALGEGVVVRNGLVLGTVPEEDSGRWNLLKSSADVNPGNSGGPLVTPDGKVIALVSALRENILYSVPAEVILNDTRSALSYRQKFRFSHLVLSNKLNSIFETSAPLPDAYTSLRRAIRGDYQTYYDISMSALFEEAPEYLTGENNTYLLASSVSSMLPEVSFVDPNDNNWKLSDFKFKTYTLEGDGRLYHTSASDINFFKIKKPLSVSLQKASADPKYIMDLILQNMRTERTLWGGDKYRILSYGDPDSTGHYRDALGRIWITAYWTIGFEDEVEIMYILPQPNGPTIVTTKQDSTYLKEYGWDLRKICDHLYTAYHGSFGEWNDFIKLYDYTPDFLKDMRFEWASEGQSFSVSNGALSISADNQVLGWSDNSELFFAPSWYKRNSKPELGLRKVILNRDQRGKEFVVFYRHIKPEPELGTAAMENWNDLAIEKFPFDGNPAISVKDNTGSVGAIIKTQQPDPDVLITLYLSVENPQSQEKLNDRFLALRNGVSVRY